MCRIERRFGISEAQLDAIRRWAERNLYVGEVRVFGSRVKWRARIDSDLDIAKGSESHRPRGAMTGAEGGVISGNNSPFASCPLYPR
jgi:hypothetical protein